jgi:hypothetical protein
VKDINAKFSAQDSVYDGHRKIVEQTLYQLGVLLFVFALKKPFK